MDGGCDRIFRSCTGCHHESTGQGCTGNRCESGNIQCTIAENCHVCGTCICAIDIHDRTFPDSDRCGRTAGKHIQCGRGDRCTGDLTSGLNGCITAAFNGDIVGDRIRTGNIHHTCAGDDRCGDRTAFVHIQDRTDSRCADCRRSADIQQSSRTAAIHIDHAACDIQMICCTHTGQQTVFVHIDRTATDSTAGNDRSCAGNIENTVIHGHFADRSRSLDIGCTGKDRHAGDLCCHVGHTGDIQYTGRAIQLKFVRLSAGNIQRTIVHERIGEGAVCHGHDTCGIDPGTGH